MGRWTTEEKMIDLQNENLEELERAIAVERNRRITESK